MHALKSVLFLALYLVWISNAFQLPKQYWTEGTYTSAKEASLVSLTARSLALPLCKRILFGNTTVYESTSSTDGNLYRKNCTDSACSSCGSPSKIPLGVFIENRAFGISYQKYFLNQFPDIPGGSLIVTYFQGSYCTQATVDDIAEVRVDLPRCLYPSAYYCNGTGWLTLRNCAGSITESCMTDCDFNYFYPNLECTDSSPYKVECYGDINANINPPAAAQSVGHYAINVSLIVAITSAVLYAL